MPAKKSRAWPGRPRPFPQWIGKRLLLPCSCLFNLARKIVSRLQVYPARIHSPPIRTIKVRIGAPISILVPNWHTPARAVAPKRSRIRGFIAACASLRGFGLLLAFSPSLPRTEPGSCPPALLPPPHEERLLAGPHPQRDLPRCATLPDNGPAVPQAPCTPMGAAR